MHGLKVVVWGQNKVPANNREIAISRLLGQGWPAGLHYGFLVPAKPMRTIFFLNFIQNKLFLKILLIYFFVKKIILNNLVVSLGTSFIESSKKIKIRYIW